MDTPARKSVMDTTGFPQIGRYGTLSLLKSLTPKQFAARGSSSQVAPPQLDDTVITSFGIDTEELTFGRDPKCSVRLYYTDVGLVHCKIMFEDRKAFLAVLGESGVAVDGYKVYPKAGGAGPTITPLSNNSEFEIHGKRFKFTYPPKDVRAALFAAPSPMTTRKLRLSMIHSAQVFSPRPSHDPRENLRTLQSPLKNQFRSPTKSSLLARSPINASPTPRGKQPAQGQGPAAGGEDEDDEEDEDIVLVEGNHPRVVQEDRDLVILEDVDDAPQQQAYSNAMQQRQQRQATIASPPLRTPPRRKSMGKNTLHRAVLIRSAQRAVIRAEEEEEEREVLESVVGEGESESDEEIGYEDEEEDYEKYGYGGPVGVPPESQSQEEDDDAMDVDGEGEEEEQQAQEENVQHKPLWRKSLDKLKIWPFGGSEQTDPEPGSSEEEEEEESEQPAIPEPEQREGEEGQGYEDEEEQEQDENQDAYDEEDEEEEADHPAPLPVMHTPARRTLGSFLTPQFKQQPKSNNLFGGRDPPATALRPSAATAAASESGNVGHARFSLGGGEARRVVVEQPWRVKDLVVPLTPSGSSSRQPATPQPSSSTYSMSLNDTPAGSSPRKGISEEERRAIKERRKSALQQPDNFFVGGVPGRGLSPSKPKSRNSVSVSPVKTSIQLEGLMRSASPTKQSGLGEEDREYGGEGESWRRTSAGEDDLDTKSLLEKMKETVEGMKRRRSVVPATPIRGAGPSGVSNTEDFATPTQQRPQQPRSVKKLYLEPEPAVMIDETAVSVEEVAKEVEEEEADASFSLLKPEARKSFGIISTPGRVGIPSIFQREAIPEAAAEQMEIDESQKHGMEQEQEKEPQAQAEKAVEEEAVEEPIMKAPGRARLLRGTVAEAEATTSTKPPSKGKASAKPPSKTRSTPKAVEEAESETSDEIDGLKAVPEAPRQTRARSRSASREPAVPVRRSTRPKTPQPEEDAMDVIQEKDEASVEQAEEDDEEPPLPPPRKPTSRTTATKPSSKTTATKPPSKTTAAKAAPKTKPKLTTPVPVARRAGKKAVQEEEIEEVEEEDELAAPPATTSRHGRKPAAEPEPEAEMEVEAEEEEPAPEPKRGRSKATTTPAGAAAKRATPAGSSAAATGRKTPTSNTNTTTSTERSKSRLRAPAARSSSRKAPAKVKDEEDVEASEHSTSEASSSRPASQASTSRPPSQASTSRPVSQASTSRPGSQASTSRPGSQASTSRAKAPTLKTPAVPAVRSRTTRGAAAAAAPTTTVAAARASRVKTPNTAPAALMNKENEEDQQEAGGVSKVKVSRSRTTKATTTAATTSGSGSSSGAAAGRSTAASGSKTRATGKAVKVKDEEEEEAAKEPPKTRIMRSTRTRTKTG